MADLEEKMKRRGKGGVMLGKGRVYTLAYANDVVLIAEEESGLRLLMREFELYVREKDLWINVDKTKVMNFRKKRVKDKEVWSMNGKSVQEVNEFCYLGYWFKWNGSQDLNVSRRIEKGGKVMKQIWEIRERRLKNDWRKRIWLFDVLVWSVISYGVEIWGWREVEKLERMHERFLRWTMGVDENSPGYMLREELGREKLVIRQRRRAMGLEEKLKQGKGSQVAQMCWALVKEGIRRGRKNISRWERGRREAIEEGRRWSGVEGDIKDGCIRKDIQ
ncbi:uncharacterized protein LOC127278503 [Leptopilina boulardi]|uniref:uncharacterized protein LOC127278503 n=1 Tax=Leptopilina boulardi TaxID=63433 RepID=UPI0021F535F9|nr:uncharacterized protein LOC127278503 [Leptopilina boulardi]